MKRENFKMPELNPEIHYLGKLCKRGHDYLDTGGSLRYKNKTGPCVLCALNRNKLSGAKVVANKYNQLAKNKVKRKKYQKEYRQTPKSKEAEKKRKQSPKAKLVRNNRESFLRANLSDSYIKKLMSERKSLNVKNITPQMIELKRELIIFNRLQKEILNELNRR